MNVFDIGARITLDTKAFLNGLEGAQSSVNSFADKAKSALGSFAKAGTAALGAATAGVAALTKQAVSAYADYEQLVGGVETLFGESAQKVLEDSEKAFQTAGMSMNDYMETSIQSAAALINSLGGDQAKAAELMNMSIVDMSDNVNKMGTTMEAVQNAYRGFSRGNFTMLDNLALGFSGTKEGMQELLDKARELSGIEYDISNYSDIVQAIHVVQTEMGITGTTAKEASETISGSISAMKAAWENMQVAFVSEDGNMAEAINGLFDSAMTVFDNVEPKIEQALGGVAAFVEKAAPIIAEKLPPIVEKILPSMLATGATLVTAIGKGIAGAIPALISSGKALLAGIMPEITSTLGLDIDLSGAFDTIEGLKDSAGGLLSTIGDIASTGFNEVIKPIAEYSIEEGSELGINVLTTAFNGLKEAIDIVKPVIEPIWENILKPMGEWTGGVFADAITTINGALTGLNIILTKDNLADLLVEIGNKFDKLGDKVGACALAFGLAKISVKRFMEEAGLKLKVELPIIRGVFVTVKDAVKNLNDVLLFLGGEVADNVRLGWDTITTGVNNFFDAVRLGWDSIGDTVDKIIDFSEKVSGSFIDMFHDDEGNFKIPFDFHGFMAKGGSLTNGQAIIAEAGPELLSVRNGVATVTPLNGKASNNPINSGVTVNVNFGGVTVTGDYDVDRMTDRAVQQLSEKLAALSVRQQRSVGGVGW